MAAFVDRMSNYKSRIFLLKKKQTNNKNNLKLVHRNHFNPCTFKYILSQVEAMLPASELIMWLHFSILMVPKEISNSFKQLLS